MLKSSLSWLGRLSPWLIIGGLSYAALFVQPTVNPAPLNQPLLEARDAFFDVYTHGAQWAIVGQNGTLLRSRDHGQSWLREELPGRANLQAVTANAEGRLVVVGNQGLLWAEQADGSWQTAHVLGEDAIAKLLDISEIAGQLWAVGEIGSLLRADSQTQQWHILNLDEDITLNSINQGPEQSLWIAAEFGRLLSSYDQGQSWQAHELGSESLRAVHFYGSTGLAVGNRGEVFVSTNQGQSWSQVPAFTQEHLYDVTYHDGRWLVTGDRGALYESHAAVPDQGWQALAPKGLSKSYHSRVLGTDQGVLLVGKEVALLGADELKHLVKESLQ